MTPLDTTAGRLRLVSLHDRPHLHTPEPHRWKLRGHLNGLIQVSGVDEKESAKLLLRFGKRAVGRGEFAVPDSDRGRHLDWFERFRHNEMTIVVEGFAVGEVSFMRVSHWLLDRPANFFSSVRQMSKYFMAPNLRYVGDDCCYY